MEVSLKKICLILFGVSYFIFLSFSLLGHIPILGGYLDALTNVGLVILLFSILLQIKTYSKKEIIVISSLFIFSFILIYSCNDYGLFKLVLFITSLKNVKLEKCISIDLYIRSFLVILVLLLYLLNIAPDVTSYFNGTTRHSLGFTNPNNLGMHVLILSFDILCLNNYKISIKKYLIIVLLLAFSDYFTGSRSTTYILLLALILIILYKRYPNFLTKKSTSFLIKNSALIFSGITFIMYILYNYRTDIGIKLNELLSNRLHNIDVYNQVYDITLFGNDNLNIGLTLDTAYAYCLYVYGIATFILFFLAFKRLFKKLYKTKKYMFVIIMFCFMVYGLSERLWLYVDYNIYMILFSLILYNTNNVSLSCEKEVVSYEKDNK